MEKKKQIIVLAAALIVMAAGVALWAFHRSPAAEPPAEDPAAAYAAQKLAERYANGQAAMEREDWEWALGIFTSLGDYADSAQQAEAAQAQIDALEARRLEDAYQAAEALEQAEDFYGAAEAFLALEDYADSASRALACWYQEGEQQEELENRGAAAIAFGKAGDYQDARARSLQLWDQVAVRRTITAGFDYTVALAEDGTLLHTRRLQLQDVYQEDPSRLGTIIAVDGLLCLRDDGTVICPWTRDLDLAEEVSAWRDIVSIADGTGLKLDGTVAQSSYSARTYAPFSDAEKWKDLVAIDGHCGLRADGTVVETGGIFRTYGQWTGVKAISCGNGCLIALREDGRLYAEAFTGGIQTDKSGLVEGIDRVVSLSGGEDARQCAVVQEDGTVKIWGDNEWGQCNTEDWTDLIAVAVGPYHTVGLKRDGTLVATGVTDRDESAEDPHIFGGQCDVEGWRVSLGAQPLDSSPYTPEQLAARLEERLPQWSCLFQEPFDGIGGTPGDFMAAGADGAAYWTAVDELDHPTIIRNTDDTAAVLYTAHNLRDFSALTAYQDHLYFLQKRDDIFYDLYRIPVSDGSPELVFERLRSFTSCAPYCLAGNWAFLTTSTEQLLAISLETPEDPVLLLDPGQQCALVSFFPADNGLVLEVKCTQDDADVWCWLHLSAQGVKLLDVVEKADFCVRYYKGGNLGLFQVVITDEAFELCRMDAVTGSKCDPTMSIPMEPGQFPAIRSCVGKTATLCIQGADERGQLWEAFYALDLTTGTIRTLLDYPYEGTHNVSPDRLFEVQQCGDDLYLLGYHRFFRITRYRGLYAGAAPVEEGFDDKSMKWFSLDGD